MTGPFVVPAPYIRGYPNGTPVQPTDAFVIDRAGVGTMYVTGLGAPDVNTRYVEYVINGSGLAIPTGVAGSGLYIPACTLVACYLQADQSATVQLGIWSAAWSAHYPPTSADTLIPGGYAILTATDHQQQDLSGTTGGQGPWFTALVQGSVWFDVHANDNATSITVALVVTTS